MHSDTYCRPWSVMIVRGSNDITLALALCIPQINGDCLQHIGQQRSSTSTPHVTSPIRFGSANFNRPPAFFITVHASRIRAGSTPGHVRKTGPREGLRHAIRSDELRQPQPHSQLTLGCHPTDTASAVPQRVPRPLSTPCPTVWPRLSVARSPFSNGSASTTRILHAIARRNCSTLPERFRAQPSQTIPCRPMTPCLITSAMPDTRSPCGSVFSASGSDTTSDGG